MVKKPLSRQYFWGKIWKGADWLAMNITAPSQPSYLTLSGWGRGWWWKEPFFWAPWQTKIRMSLAKDFPSFFRKGFWKVNMFYFHFNFQQGLLRSQQDCFFFVSPTFQHTHTQILRIIPTACKHNIINIINLNPTWKNRWNKNILNFLQLLVIHWKVSWCCRWMGWSLDIIGLGFHDLAMFGLGGKKWNQNCLHPRKSNIDTSTYKNHGFLTCISCISFSNMASFCIYSRWFSQVYGLIKIVKWRTLHSWNYWSETNLKFLQKPLKNDAWKLTVLLQWFVFTGYVHFRRYLRDLSKYCSWLKLTFFQERLQW